MHSQQTLVWDFMIFFIRTHKYLMMKLRHHPVNPVKIKYDSQNDNQTSNIYEHNRGGSVSSIKETISSSSFSGGWEAKWGKGLKRLHQLWESTEADWIPTQDPPHIVM